MQGWEFLGQLSEYWLHEKNTVCVLSNIESRFALRKFCWCVHNPRTEPGHDPTILQCSEVICLNYEVYRLVSTSPQAYAYNKLYHP
jgi:hypothetical protein